MITATTPIRSRTTWWVTTVFLPSPSSAAHTASPYTITLASYVIKTGELYDVTMEYIDADGVSNGSQSTSIRMGVWRTEFADGDATAVPGAAAGSIDVSMAYSGDQNANNSFTVQYQSVCCSWPTWVANAPHVASPYTTTITGLTPGASYNVRMTYNDPDTVKNMPYGAPDTSSGYTVNYVVATPQTNATTAGTATAVAVSDTTIDISMPYSVDDNANNTYTVEYKLTSESTWIDWGTAAHTASPYTDAITGLTPGASYDVRLTYNDVDGVNGTNPQAFSIVPTNATTAGTATAVAAATGTTINISMPYTEDYNADSTYTVDYKLNSSCYLAWTNWVTNPPAHTATPVYGHHHRT